MTKNLTKIENFETTFFWLFFDFTYITRFFKVSSPSAMFFCFLIIYHQNKLKSVKKLIFHFFKISTFFKNYHQYFKKQEKIDFTTIRYFLFLMKNKKMSKKSKNRHVIFTYINCTNFEHLVFWGFGGGPKGTPKMW